MLRFLLRFTLYSLLVGMVLYSIGLIMPVRDALKDMLGTFIEKNTGFTISLDNARWYPPLGIALDHLELKNAEGTKVHIEKTYVSFLLPDLIKGTMGIRSLDLTNIDVTIAAPANSSSQKSTPEDLLLPLLYCPVEVMDFNIKGVRIAPLTDLIFQGKLSCDPVSSESTIHLSVQKEQLQEFQEPTLLTVKLQRTEKKLNVSAFIEEPQGGVLINSYSGHLIDSVSLKVFATNSIDSEGFFPITGRFEFEAKGNQHKSWEISSHGDFQLDKSLNIAAQTHAHLRIDGWDPVILASTIKGTSALLTGDIKAILPSKSSSANLKFSLSKFSQLTLDPIHAAWNNAEIEGALTLGFSPITVNGILNVTHLEHLMPSAKGNLAGQIQFLHVNDSQSILGNFKGKELYYHQAYVNEISLDVELTDLLRDLNGKITLDMQGAAWKEKNLGSLTASSKIFSRDPWPFNLQIRGNEPRPWNMETQGEWIANCSKARILLKEAAGFISNHPIAIQRPWEIIYENQLFTLSPLLFNLGEGTVSLTLQEEGNGYRLSTEALNIPYGLENWNIKSNASWPAALNSLDLDLEIDQKSLVVSASMLLDLIKNTGKVNVAYLLPQAKGTIFSQMHWEKGILKLTELHADSDEWNGKGNLALEPGLGTIQGAFHAELKHFPLKTWVSLHGNLQQIIYTATARYSPENLPEHITLTSDGSFSEGKLTGMAETSTLVNHIPLKAQTSYEIDFDICPKLALSLNAGYSDKENQSSHPGMITLNAELAGPFDALRGIAVFSGSDTRIDNNNLPPWKLITQLNYPYSQQTFSLHLENGSEIEGSWSLENSLLSLQLGKGIGKWNEHKIQLTAPWTIQWNQSQIALSPLTVSIDKGLLQIDGQATKDYFKFFFKGSGLPISLPFPHESALPLNGKLALEGAFEGPWNAPQGLLHLSVEDLQLIDKFFGKAPLCHASFDFSLKPSRSIIQGEIICPSIEPMTLNANIPLSLSLYPFNLSMDYAADFALDLKASGALGPALDIFLAHSNAINGYLSLTLNVLGSLNQPKITGHLAVSDGYYENLETGTVLKNITLKARSEGNKIDIEQLQASDNKEGTLNGKGHLLLENTQGFPFELSCRLNKMVLVQTDFVRSGFEGDILLIGDKKGALIKGNVNAVSTHIYIPEEIPEGVDSLEVTFVNLPKNREKNGKHEIQISSFEYPITLDLNLTSNRLHMMGRGLESIWKGQIHLTGPVNAPLIQGEMKVNSGSYIFKGKNFDIHQGNISFSGPFDKTKLYIIGRHEIDDVQIDAIFRGPIKNPALAFRSNPPMSQRQIVSVLLFGKGASEISPYAGRQPAHSISNLACGDDAPDILSQVRDRLQLDRLDINRELTSEGSKVSVQVGKYISKRLFVSLNKSITDDTNSIAIDAKLINHVKARAEVTDNAETQLLLKWKHDF